MPQCRVFDERQSVVPGSLGQRAGHPQGLVRDGAAIDQLQVMHNPVFSARFRLAERPLRLLE